MNIGDDCYSRRHCDKNAVGVVLHRIDSQANYAMRSFGVGEGAKESSIYGVFQRISRLIGKWELNDHSPAFDYLPDSRCEIFRSAVFIDVGSGAGPQTTRSILVFRLDAHHDHREQGINPPHVLQYFQAIAPRHIDIEQQEVMVRLYQLCEHLITVRGFGKARISKRIDQDFSQAAPYVRVIICYQDIHCRSRLPGRKVDLKTL